MAEPPKTRTPPAYTASPGPTLSVSSVASSTSRSRVLFAARMTRLMKVHLLPRDLKSDSTWTNEHIRGQV